MTIAIIFRKVEFKLLHPGNRLIVIYLCGYDFAMTSASATLATVGLKQLTPAEIDRLAGEFLELEQKADDAYKIAIAADEPHEKMKEKLIDLVEEFGSSHAEKSKLLHGIEYEMMATFGVSTSIDAAAVQRFATALRLARQKNLFNRMFEQTVRYTLSPDASSIIRSVALPKHLLSMFAQCAVTKARTPTLKVRRIVWSEQSAAARVYPPKQNSPRSRLSCGTGGTKPERC